MFRQLLRRILAAFIVMFLVSLATFAALEVVPGNAAIVSLGTEGNVEQLAALEAQLGLDRPLGERLFDYYSGLIRFDWGTSSYYGQPVWTLISQRLAVTFPLALASVLLALLIAITLGTVAAVRKGGVVDIISRSLVQLASAMPSFWLSLLLLVLFSSVLRLVPMGGYVSPSEDFGAYLNSIVLPLCVLVVGETGPLLRLVRSSMLEAIGEDWYTAAQVKGLRKGRVIVSYALRSALTAPLTSAGTQLAKLLGGTAIVESVFALPGMGRLFLTAVEMRDLQLVQGIVIFVSFFVVLMNLVTDIVLRLVNPALEPDGGGL